MSIDPRQASMAEPLIGTAGWAVPRAVADFFPATGSHLERYAGRMPAVEINSSFYRPHRRATYQRWAASTPAAFRFSVKIPKQISHVARMVDTGGLLDVFVEQIAGLGDKLGVILLQLPPSMVFDHDIASTFLEGLRPRLGRDAGVACEPRHPSWFGAEADACLVEHRVARVAADPVVAPGAERPGGWPGLHYHRLHGSPRTYYSAYDGERLAALAERLAADRPAGATWCIFDNTAAGAALGDALALRSLLG